jgi:predicted dehydrogenase
MSGAVRVGLVGAGAMGALHARVLAQSPRTELAFVCDPGPAGADVAARFGVPHVHTLDSVRDVDAVIVASATETHRELALEVIRAGRPLLVEKPLADRLDGAEEIVAASAAAGLPLMCGFLERYNPTIMTAMEFVDRPLHVSAVRHSPYVPRIRTGVASDLLIHDIDIVVRMLGEPDTVAGRLGYFHPGSLPTSEDVAEALLQFPGGAIASVSASRLSQRKIRSMTIVDLDRLVEIDLLRQDITIYRHVENSPATDDGLGYRQQTIIDIPVVRYRHEPLVAQLDRFCDLLDGSADADEERATLLAPHRVIEQVRTSGRSPAPA